MYALSHLLADTLASDHLWFALVFLAALAIMAGFKVAGGRIGKRRRRRLQRAVR
jgi:hypothetical protein